MGWIDDVSKVAKVSRFFNFFLKDKMERGKMFMMKDKPVNVILIKNLYKNNLLILYVAMVLAHY